MLNIPKNCLNRRDEPKVWLRKLGQLGIPTRTRIDFRWSVIPPPLKSQFFLFFEFFFFLQRRTEDGILDIFARRAVYAD